MSIQSKQSQYLTMMKQKCGLNLPTSLACETNTPSSPYPPEPGEHVLKKPDTEVGEQDFSVNWFKFIQPSPNPRMTETSVQKLVHVASSPIAFMNYKWIINSMMDTTFSIFSHQKSIFHPLFIPYVISSQTSYTLVKITFAPTKS